MVKLPHKGKLLRQVAPARDKWGPRPPEVTLEPTGGDEENVWNYPRPPAVQDCSAVVYVEFAGEIIARSQRTKRVIETAGAPVYYFPPTDVKRKYLAETDDVSICEWKGAAIYYDLVVGEICSESAAFAYPDPLDDLGRGYSQIAGWISFYPARVELAIIGDERVQAQPGDVYAGWVTPNIKGPIKGEPGTEPW